MDEKKFVEEHRALVLSIVQKVKTQFDLTNIENDDLVAAGFEGLLAARQRFDSSRNVKFSTYAYYRIRGAVIDSIRKQGYGPRSTSATMRALEAADLVAEASGEKLAANPSPDVAANAEALATALSRISSAFVIAAVGQSEVDRPEDAEEKLLREENRERVRNALGILSEREMALIRGFYFEGRRFDEVALELGISKSWGSRIHLSALSKLQKHLKSPH